MRGGEIVFEALIDLFPRADVFTLIYEPDKLSPRLRQKLRMRDVHVSWMNRTAFTRRLYRQLLPILPFAVRSLDVYPYDLVLSSSHCVAKGVRKHPGATHVSYIHAPMRYMWSRFDDYFGKGKTNALFRLVARVLRPLLQAWDRVTSRPARVDRFIANSRFIADEVRRVWGREASVVYPFARLERFNRPRQAGGAYLMVGAFAPYKRTDLAIEAFARLGLPLKIVGDGQERDRLVALRDRLNARNIEFVVNPGNEQIESLYASCRAFVFPGEEDFGITPLEAQACGRPVIAYGRGGVLETVTPDTGLFFDAQSPDALVGAVRRFDAWEATFRPAAARAQAERFGRPAFLRAISAHVQATVALPPSDTGP